LKSPIKDSYLYQHVVDGINIKLKQPKSKPLVPIWPVEVKKKYNSRTKKHYAALK
jgi:hypothetical protein